MKNVKSAGFCTANQVEFIVINSYTKGSSVKTNNAKTKQFILESQGGQSLDIDYKLIPTCRSSGAREVDIYCENQGFFSSAIELKTIFGKLPDGFSGDYNSNSLKIPETSLNNEKYKKLEKETKNITQNGSPQNSGKDDCITTSSGDMICGGEGEDTIVF